MNPKSADEFVHEIYDAAFHGHGFSSKEIIEAIEKFKPEYTRARIALQCGEKARDMYECVEKALQHFNSRWEDPNWIYFSIGGKKTCQDVLKWLEVVIEDHVAYRAEHGIEMK